MARVVDCPRCRHRLRVGDEADVGLITCPRCLALIELTPSGEPAAVAAGLTPSPVPEREPECRRCGAPVRRAWRYCPDCNAPLRVAGRRPARRPDVEARGDRTATAICLTILGLFLALGVGLFFFVVPLDVFSVDPELAAVGALGCGLVLLIAVGSGVLIVVSKDATTKALSAALGTLGMMAGMLLVGGVLLVCLVILTIQQCLQGCTKINQPPPARVR